MRRAFAAFAVLAAVLLLEPAALRAQDGPPRSDSLRNLKVLPRTMTRREVIGVMRGFTAGLGVRCQFCHVGQEGRPETEDFASDDKVAKRKARVMLQMVQGINGQNLAQLPEREDPQVQVTCFTCHRGVAVPRPLGEIVERAALAGGLDSATRAYTALRERYYGRAAYDFGDGTLAEAALDLARQRRLDEALGIVRLDLQYYPQSAPAHVALGDVQRLRGDTASALAEYRQALALDSTSFEARQRLREMAGRR